MQEHMAYAGCNDVYSQSNDLISRFLCIEINSMQVWRVTNTWGAQSVAIINPSVAQEVEISKKEVVYAQLDGAMLLTREDKWKETKTGRVFKQSDILTLSEKRKELKASLYVSHLGGHEEFLEKFEPIVDIFDELKERLVILSDGAVWIRNWSKESYPNATHILDFYHVCEHLNQFLDFYEPLFDDKVKTLNNWKDLLLTKGAAPIIEILEKITSSKKTIEQQRDKLLNYLKVNEFRLDYHQYIARGLCIGSGAIEAAQRTVIQSRMKKSGQRWSSDKAQNMLNLRVAKLSDKWENVILKNTNYSKAA